MDSAEIRSETQLPDDWRSRRLGDLGATYGGLTGKGKDDFGTGSARYITFLNVLENVVLDPDRFEAVRIGGRERQNKALAGDLFFNGSSETPEEVGMCSVLQDTTPDLYLNSFCIGFRPRRDAGVEPLFLAHYFRSGEGRKLFSSLAQGSTRYNLSKAGLKHLSVAIPPLREQRAIADVLRDADQLVEALTKLIVKERDVRQAVAEELLSSGRRLPGFDGAWRTISLAELGSLRGGTGFPVRLQGGTVGKFPFFKVSDMNHAENRRVMVRSNNWISEHVRKDLGAALHPTGSVVFAKVGAAVFLERKRLLVRPSCLDNNMMSFKPNPLLADSSFIHYALEARSLSGLVSTTALPALTSGVLSTEQLTLPDIREQRAIAAVISDCDRAIELLDERLSKTRALKEAMAQELLSGRIRLAAPSQAPAEGGSEAAIDASLEAVAAA